MGEYERAKRCVFQFFAAKVEIPGATEQEKMLCDYLTSGLIDSLGVIELITYIEDELKLELTREDFENPEFKTIGGLINILTHKLKPID